VKEPRGPATTSRSLVSTRYPSLADEKMEPGQHTFLHRIATSSSFEQEMNLRQKSHQHYSMLGLLRADWSIAVMSVFGVRPWLGIYLRERRGEG
jgi:hypothetical protein